MMLMSADEIFAEAAGFQRVDQMDCRTLYGIFRGRSRCLAASGQDWSIHSHVRR
jgi:hypothetical protein